MIWKIEVEKYRIRIKSNPQTQALIIINIRIFFQGELLYYYVSNCAIFHLKNKFFIKTWDKLLLRVKSGKQGTKSDHYFVCFWNVLTHSHLCRPSNLLTSLSIVLNFFELFLFLARARAKTILQTWSLDSFSILVFSYTISK